MRFLLPLLAFFCLPVLLRAQVPTNQDCDGAIAVCQNLYQQTNSFSGPGNYPNEINGFNSCLGAGELNSVWYTFTVQQGGNLCFSISPINGFDDYDWAVFDLTDADCADIATTPGLEVSCNFAPNVGCGGVTGPTGNFANCPAQNEPCIPVLAGQTYAINISNFSSTQFGYLLDFSSSSAVIFDNVTPQIDSVVTPVFCGTTSLSFRFTENVECNSVSDADFELAGPGGPYTLSGVSGAVCAAGGTQENTFSIDVTPAITTPGLYALRLTGNAGSVNDLCGNTADTATRFFFLDFIPIQAGNDDALTFCNTQGAVNLFSLLTGNPDPGGQWIRPNGTPFGGTFIPSIDPSGSYRYLVGNAPCPVDTATLDIQILPPPDAGTGGPLVICDTLPVDLFAQLGGTPAANGSWTGPGGAFGGTFQPGNDPPGTYTYTVPAAGVCPAASASLTITVTAPLSLSAASVQGPACFGEANGSVTLAAAGGGGGLSYSLDGVTFQASPTFAGLPAGPYSFTVRDANFCSRQFNLTLTEPSALTLSLDQQANIACNGGSTGSLSLSGSGGSPAYAFSLNGSPFQANGSFAGLPAGSYTVILRDDSLCADTLTTTLTAPTPLTLTLDSTRTIDCYGNASGGLFFSANGGSPAYAFSLNGNPFQASGSFTGLPDGSYTVTVRDDSLCTEQQTITLTEPDSLSLAITQVLDVDCFGNNTGQIDGLATGGTLPYSYNLNAGPGQAGGSFPNLFGGIYTLHVTDARGCAAAADTAIVTPTGLTAGVDSLTPVDCFGNASGTVAMIALGGTAPYAYSLDGVNFTQPNPLVNLPAGTDTVTVRDANACIVRVPFTMTEPALLTLAIDQQRNVDCNGNSTGAISLLAQGGNAAYQYQLDAGPFQASPTLPGLSAGTYTLAVEDSLACRTTLPVTITEPSLLTATLDQQRNVDCKDNATGAITLLAQGGSPAYAYQLDAGPFQAVNSFAGLAAGTYTVTVRDDSLCTTPVVVTITEPDSLFSAIVRQENVDCNGNATGDIELGTSGGTAPYQYQLDAGPFQATNVFGGLAAGSYLVTVQDDSACVTTVPVTITEPSPLTGSIVFQQDVDCFGNATAAVATAGSGGTGPYLYALDTAPFQADSLYAGLPAGGYVVSIQDDSLCLITVPVTISEPPLLTLAIDIQKNVACFGDSSAELTLLGGGGTQPFSYEILGQTPQASPFFPGLPAGAYTLVVQDDSLCTDTLTTTVTEPPLLTFAIDWQRNVACFGDSSGGLQLTGAGGVPAYAFSLDGGPFQADSLFDQLPVGTYTLVIRDDSLCTDTLTTTVTEPPALAAQIDSLLAVDCFGNATGSVAIAANGGVGPYQYQLDTSPFQADSFFTGLLSGNYLVTVQDDSLCTEEVPVFIPQPDSLILTLTDLQDVDCFGNRTGEVELAGTGGIFPYLFQLDGQSPQAGSIFGELPAGAYFFTVADSNGCVSAVLPVTVSEPPLLTLALDTLAVRCFGESNGQAIAQPVGGTPPYQYQWDDPAQQTDSIATGLVAGLYTLLLTDAQGCDTTALIPLREPDTLVLDLVDFSDPYCTLPNGEAEVQATGGNGIYRYSWNSQPTQDQARATALLPGSYLATVTDWKGCEDTLTVEMGDTPPAQPAFSSLPDLNTPILESDGTLQFLNQSQGATSYVWDLAGTLSQEEEPVFTFTEPGTYVVSLTAFNEFLICPVTLTDTVTIIPDGRLFVANAFSPNQDGHNDFFQVAGEGIVEMELKIFDRWGREIRRLQSPVDQWDGFLPRGDPAPEGVYAYVLTALFNSGQRLERGGTITLFR
ncbi:MAG: hypothetical protein D6722_28045 [Bacteroidetes bacterium]|nr:MAG: hypothetical protein D6722_28045 [Bacteroidota bacterium]